MPNSSRRHPSGPRRGFTQRLILGVNLLAAVACLIGGALLFFGQRVVSSQRKTAPVINLAKTPLPDNLCWIGWSHKYHRILKREQNGLFDSIQF